MNPRDRAIAAAATATVVLPILRAGLDAARTRYRTLAAQPSEAEQGLTFTILGDLLEPAIEEVLPGLPEHSAWRWRWRCCGAMPPARATRG